MNYPRLTFGVFLTLFLIPCSFGWAQGSDQMGFTTYYFTDSGENSVVTTSFNLAKEILEQTVLLVDIELDNVTVPAVTAVTGATRPQRNINKPFEKNRGQMIVGVEQGLGPYSSMAANFYRSQEVDYISNSVIGTFTQELFDKNTTLTFRGQYNADEVGKITPTGDLLTQKKKVYTGAVVLTQLLSANTVLDVFGDFTYLSGFLSDPYRQVAVYPRSDSAFIKIDELHPSKRYRSAGTAKISQMLPSVKASIMGSYRFYFDDWKVRSSTIEVRLNKYIVNDLIFGVDFRYYSQSAAKFYQDRYIGTQYLGADYRTSDYKLKEFNSNNFGFSLTWLLRGLGKSNPDLEFLQNSSFEITYFRYFNTLDFSADILQAGLKFSI